MLTYTVRKGDSLSAIAHRLHVRVGVLAHINSISNVNMLRVGQVLALPPTSRLPAEGPIGRAPPPRAGALLRHSLRHLRGLAPPAPHHSPRAARLGDLSMRYETGHRPGQELVASATVSSGVHDPGGVSYGAYQLSSVVGRVASFLRKNGAPWASAFGTEDPKIRDGAFAQTWKRIAQRDGWRFYEAQHDFIRATHYDRVINRIYRATGINLDQSGIAVRNVVWSCAVQHGRAARIIEEAMAQVHGAQRVAQDGLSVYQRNHLSFATELAYERALIIAIYAARRAYVINTVKQPNLVKRYDAEEPDALAELATYGTERTP